MKRQMDPRLSKFLMDSVSAVNDYARNRFPTLCRQSNSLRESYIPLNERKKTGISRLEPRTVFPLPACFSPRYEEVENCDEFQLV